VLAPYARQTQRLSSALLELVHASNAESAARVGGLLGYVTSPDTLIRLQRQEQFPVLATQILGVDEFARRRGCTYGTILIDLEAHQPVDVLEGKQAEPLAQWLGAILVWVFWRETGLGLMLWLGALEPRQLFRWRTGSIWSITSEMP
jgi:transposase